MFRSHTATAALVFASAVFLTACAVGVEEEPGGDLALSRTTVRLVGEAGDPGPGPEEISVTQLDGSVGELEVLVVYPNGQPTEWVEATLSARTAPATLSVVVDPTRLERGAYRAAILVRGERARNGDQVLLIDADLTCSEVRAERVAVCGSFVDATPVETAGDGGSRLSPPGTGARPAADRGS